MFNVKEIKEFLDESGIIIASDVFQSGFSKSVFYKFTDDNNFERVAHGIYASPEAWTDENYILSLRCPNAIFSHDEALYHYRLIDHEPQKRTITVYTGYGTGRLISDNIGVYTVKKELLELGKTFNTRMRDYYDIHILLSGFENQIDKEIIKEAFIATCEKRETIKLTEQGEKIIKRISADEAIKELWKAYQNKYFYAFDILFDEVLDSAEKLFIMAV